MNSTISTHHHQHVQILSRSRSQEQPQNQQTQRAHNNTNGNNNMTFNNNMMAEPLPDFDSDFERMFIMLQQQSQQQQREQCCGFFASSSSLYPSCGDSRQTTANNNSNINQMPLLPPPTTLPSRICLSSSLHPASKRRRLNSTTNNNNNITRSGGQMMNIQLSSIPSNTSTRASTTTNIPTIIQSVTANDIPFSAISTSSIEVAAAIPTIAEVLVTTDNEKDSNNEHEKYDYIPLVEAIPIVSTATTATALSEDISTEANVKSRKKRSKCVVDTSAMDYLPGQDIKLTNLKEPFELFNGMVGMIHERRTNGKIIVRIVDKEVDNLLLLGESDANEGDDKEERRPLFLAVRSHNIICMAQTQLIG